MPRHPSSCPLAPVLLLAALLAPHAAAGQQPPVDFTAAPAQAAVSETDHLTVKVSSSRPASPGSRVSLFVDVTPKPTMHVYAPGQKTYIPISIRLAADPLVKAHAPLFPEAEPYFFKPLGETQLVYSKAFRIVQDVTLAGSAERYTSSTLTISGTVRYQACDDRICYLPKSVPVAWKLPVTIPDVIK